MFPLSEPSANAELPNNMRLDDVRFQELTSEIGRVLRGPPIGIFSKLRGLE